MKKSQNYCTSPEKLFNAISSICLELSKKITKVEQSVIEITQSCENGVVSENSETLQNFDLINQNLNGLSQFLRKIEFEGNTEIINVRDALEAVPLEDLRSKLVHSEQPESFLEGNDTEKRVSLF